SGGAFPGSLLKVDILNVMGVGMMAGAMLWGLGRGPGARAAICAAVTVAIAMVTPLVRASTGLAALPDPLEWYLRPAPGSTTFTLFPWAAFLTGGIAAWVWLDRFQMPSAEARGVAALTLAGVLTAAAGYGASYLPPLYES